MFQNVEKNINNRQDFNEAFYDKKDKMKIAIKFSFKIFFIFHILLSTISSLHLDNNISIKLKSIIR